MKQSWPQHSLGVVLFLVDSKCLQWGADIVRTAPSFPQFLPIHCWHYIALAHICCLHSAARSLLVSRGHKLSS